MLDRLCLFSCGCPISAVVCGAGAISFASRILANDIFPSAAGTGAADEDGTAKAVLGAGSNPLDLGRTSVDSASSLDK